ncbi:acyl-CoA desaturase [Reichenbachiella agarivorans]|uniref:Acyl-CoA desaturase n=1 Tax=Reichenbachiella agarivorans TaxID=2979464 RepID=A0ABY6CMN3_9BACT|nr:acyl-CoA desaturase [Reichenbachiella agarivorans]UXP31737.1 acyl-CoA desaturase [Reichenbachiella agarivorans]
MSRLYLKNNSNIEHIKFSKTTQHAEFSNELRSKVREYFTTHNTHRYANANMVFKTIFMISLFLIPLIVLCLGLVSSTPMLFVMYMISGLGMTGIGMGVMHDALHGSYSTKTNINKWVGYSINLIGANASVWKIQHNVLHHTYTNIEDSDDDLNMPYFLRFSPNTKYYGIHKFQHIYVWFFYGLLTLIWVSIKDFIRIMRYHKLGFFKKRHEVKIELAKAVLLKVMYYGYSLIIPIIMLPIAPWVIVVAFLSMHFMTGLFISVVFQTAHIMTSNEFPNPDEHGMIDDDWSVHQLATTSNYAPKSRLLSWFIGGLNFQIEHHLLPNVCHVHYKKLSVIVSETALKYDIPYHSQRTFVSAISDHFRMLRSLGQVA